jgi:hypothetical protein
MLGTHWIGEVNGASGGCRIGQPPEPRVTSLDEMLAAVREAALRYGRIPGPSPPFAPPPPPPPPVEPQLGDPTPRRPRGARRTDQHTEGAAQ